MKARTDMAMNFTARAMLLAAAFGMISATASAQTQSRYQGDLNECRAVAENTRSTLTESAKGAAVGALGGAALGAVTGAVTGGKAGKGAAIGAGTGAVVGGGYQAYSTEQEKKRIVDDCMRRKGYNVVN